MVKVGFTGAHGVGKSTLCRELAHSLARAGLTVEVTPEIPRQIVEETGDPSFFRRGENTIIRQLCIITRQIVVEMSAAGVDVLLCDRTLLDHWCYTIALHGNLGDSRGRRVWGNTVQAYLTGYDMVFYVPVEFPVLDDGVREDDSKFQREIDDVLRTQLESMGVLYDVVRGSVAERVTYCEARIVPMAKAANGT